MAIPEPDAALWRDVKPYTEWPATDEFLMQDLARAWTEAGTAFLGAGAPRDSRLAEGWNDRSGATFRDRIAELRGALLIDGNQMKHAAWLAREYGYDVGHAKTEIRRVIEANDATYANLNGILGLFADTTGRQDMVNAMAGSINTFLAAMAERIAARGRDEPELPRPVFTAESPERPRYTTRWCRRHCPSRPGAERTFGTRSSMTGSSRSTRSIPITPWADTRPGSSSRQPASAAP